MRETAKWEIFELKLKGPSQGNPFLESELRAEARCGERVQTVEGFYDGDGVYLLRVMPDQEGEWRFRTKSNRPELDGVEGSFLCTPPRDGVHGPVRVDRDPETGVTRGTRFHYADGTDYQPVGTTCYCWNHQPEELEEETLRTLAASPFNKLRMCVFPKHFDYNHNEPPRYAFEGSRESGWDFERFRPDFFRHLEGCIKRLGDMGIEADLILFHEYDRWGFSTMPPEADRRYLRYLAARLSAFRNLWWSLANEFDLMKAKTMEDWDEFFQIIRDCDPVGHLRSIHNSVYSYDHSKPWVTHMSVQTGEMEKVAAWMSQLNKPVVVDECCYEGDISHSWGNLTPEEMVNRMWTAFSLGAYAGHGETYWNREEVLWWSKGGRLHGESPRRIAFLREFFRCVTGKPELARNSWGAPEGIHLGEELYLYYYNGRQPAFKDLNLPEDKKYRVEVADAWNCTLTPVEGEFSGACTVPMPRKPYQGLRITRIS